MPDSDYLLCAFVEEHDQDDVFVEWPLHITLVPWFIESNMPDFQLRLLETLKDTKSLSVAVDEKRVWGVHTVNVIQPSQILKDIHKMLLAAVKVNGRLIINEQYTDQNYTPHVTHQHDISLSPGDTVKIEDIYVVERDTNTHMKTILYKIRLT